VSILSLQREPLDQHQWDSLDQLATALFERLKH
jgi:hypothetical protein